MAKCPNCGVEVESGAKFCMECGTRVIAEPTQEHVGASVDDDGNVQRACDEQKENEGTVPAKKRGGCPRLLLSALDNHE